jgi:hypothetical protein
VGRDGQQAHVARTQQVHHPRGVEVLWVVHQREVALRQAQAQQLAKGGVVAGGEGGNHDVVVLMKVLEETLKLPARGGGGAAASRAGGGVDRGQRQKTRWKGPASGGDREGAFCWRHPGQQPPGFQTWACRCGRRSAGSCRYSLLAPMQAGQLAWTPPTGGTARHGAGPCCKQPSPSAHVQLPNTLQGGCAAGCGHNRQQRARLNPFQKYGLMTSPISNGSSRVNTVTLWRSLTKWKTVTATTSVWYLQQGPNRSRAAAAA